MTLSRQILAFGLGLTALLSLLSIAGLVLMRNVTLPALHDNLERKTRMTLSSLSRLDIELATGAIDELERAVELVAEDSDLVYVRISDRSGTPLYQRGSRPHKVPEVTADQSEAVISNRELSFGGQNIDYEGAPLGRVEVAFSARGIAAMKRWLRVLATVSAVTLLVCVFTSLRFSRAMVDPIARMIEFAKEVEEGNLRHRVIDNGGPPELRALADHLNLMTESVQERDRQLAAQRFRLQSTLQTMRNTREQLVQSTRLASVGEMAGRTAHEVLNPITSMHGRLTRVSEALGASLDEDIDIIKEILDAWQTSYRDGGPRALIDALSEACGDDANKVLLEEDLENLHLFVGEIEDWHRTLQDDLRFLLREVDRVTHFIDGMRSMTRTSSSKEMHAIGDILTESADILDDALSKRNVSIEILGDTSPRVLVDRYELIQVVTNLVRNAMLAIEEHRGRRGGQITLSVETVANRVLVRVADDGPGIAEEHRELLFDSSFTTRKSSEGTGLGLAIARRLVRGFGGSLCLEDSLVDAGSVFLIDLPCADAAQRVASTTSTSERPLHAEI